MHFLKYPESRFRGWNFLRKFQGPLRAPGKSLVPTLLRSKWSQNPLVAAIGSGASLRFGIADRELWSSNLSSVHFSLHNQRRCLTGQAPSKKFPIGANGVNFGFDFLKFRTQSGDSEFSRLQQLIMDDLMDFGTQNESSGACLRQNVGHVCEKCERILKISNFKIKKSANQSLNFLSRSFLSGS